MRRLTRSRNCVALPPAQAGAGDELCQAPQPHPSARVLSGGVRGRDDGVGRVPDGLQGSPLVVLMPTLNSSGFRFDFVLNAHRRELLLSCDM